MTAYSAQGNRASGQQTAGVQKKERGPEDAGYEGRWSLDGYTHRQDPRPYTEDSQQPPSAGLLWRSETRFRIILATCLVYQKAQERKAVITLQHWWGARPLDTASSRSPLGSAWARQPQPWHSSGLNCQSHPAPGHALWITLPPNSPASGDWRGFQGRVQKESMLWRWMKSGLTPDS